MLDVDFLQFARLLDEINAVGLTQDQIQAVAKSMDIEPKDVKQLLNRAAAKWDEIKGLMLKKTPLTEDQVSEELAENGRVEALVSIDFGELIGQLEDVALEDFIDDLSERAAGVSLSNVDHKVMFADGDTLYVKVSANADEMEEEEEEEEPVVE